MSSTQQSIESVLNNTYVSGFIRIFIILYAVLAAPRLPAWISKLFHHSAFQIVMFALIAYTATKDISISLLIALAFFVSFHSYTRHLISKISSRVKRTEAKPVMVDSKKDMKSVDSSMSSDMSTKSEKFENPVKEAPYVSHSGLGVQQVDQGLSYDQSSLDSDESDAKLENPYHTSMKAHPASGALPGFGGMDYSTY